MILRSRESYFLVSSDSNQNLKVKTLKFHHGNQKPFFYFKNESDGTQRLLDLLEILLTQRDKVFVIDAEGATHLYSLDEFNVRFDKKVDKAYLEGRYGGVPLFASMFPPLEKEGVDDED
jgi:AAA15 family ATPase/GTPase